MSGKRCARCAAGTYASSGNIDTACSSCEAGKYSNVNGSLACTVCDAGTYADSSGSTTCQSCIAGTYQGTSGQSSCTSCEVGRFTSTPGALSCTACTVGTIAAVESSTVCTACLAGSYATTGESNCTACDTGKYSSSDGASQCIDCSAGTASRTTGSSVCSACEKGKYAPTAGSASCTLCPAFHYSLESGQIACKRCEWPSIALTAGASICSACVEGYYLHTLLHECIECPEGAICEENTTLKTLKVEQGFYRFELWSSEIFSCPYPNNCKGGSGTAGDASCISGAFGPLCEMCEADYFLEVDGTKACTSCDDATRSTKVIALFIIVAVLFVIGVILLLAFVKKNLEVIKAYYNERKERIKEIGGKITALVVTMQIIILVNENHKDLRGNGFPQPFEQFIEFFNFLTLDMINIIPVGCIFGHVSHYNKLVVWTVGPTAMVAIVGTVICFVKEATTKVRVSFSRFVVYERM